MRKRHVDALNLKPGPTESGYFEPIPEPEVGLPVGGELVPTDILPAFLSQYWLLMILLLLPLGFLFYKKRNVVLPWILKLFTR
ncbi:MAG: hypothetical protein L6M37_05180 [Candidatus Methylarchaceae archaeon HK02M1]|nr:hypothetical protein [Candidatus Methylarchaceae archaeon HK02M1]